MHTISFALVLLFTSTALADQVAQSEIDVIDGSTVRVHGQVIHIIGIESRRGGCRDILITENLAHPYACGLYECPRPKPWCPFDTE